MERQYIQAQSRVCNKEGFIEIVVQETNFCGTCSRKLYSVRHFIMVKKLWVTGVVKTKSAF